MPDVLLLELDGVLLDVAASRRDAVRQVLADEGVHVLESTLDELLSTYAQTAAVVRSAAAIAGLPMDATAIDLAALRVERELELHVAAGPMLAPGAADFIDRARGRTRLALVTTAPRRRAASVLALAGLSDAFEVMTTADDVLHGKPDPESHQSALSRLDRRRPVSPGRALAIEPTRDGLRAALASGVRAVGVGAMPAHLAVEADAFLPALIGATLEDLDRLAPVGARVQ